MKQQTDVQRQDEYVENLEKSRFDYGLIVGEAFIRGMRDIGYKHSGTAIDELVDNGIEAGAQNVHVLLGFGDSRSDSKPHELAVVDDGHGMSDKMIRAAILWGGGHRTDTRELFGRYGFGLPSSSVSQGRRFEVYSKRDGGEWHMSYIDLDEIKDGTFYKEDNRLAAPPPVKAVPPAWLLERIREHYKKDLTHGTIVVISKLDNLTWTTSKNLTTNLVQHFGVVYRNWLRRTNIFVQGTKVRSVDPLFLDESAQFFDENDVRAEALPETQLMVKDQDSREELGKITVRYSYLPPGFQNEDGKVGGKVNSRFKVMKEHNGILVLRAGRQIDVVNNRCPWLTFQTYDRNWKAEIDFDPQLDEEFSITTSKQQINLSERMWKQLEQAGVKRAIEGLRKRYNDAVPAAKEKQEQPTDGAKRTSEEVMEAARKFKTTRSETSPSQEEERENLNSLIKRKRCGYDCFWY